MKRQFVLGVDGGNTKTDYFLFDTEGNFVSHLRAGTCSHERMPDSYEGAYRMMKQHIEELLQQQNIHIEEIKVGVFGLAGLDVPEQKENLEQVIRRIGITTFVADNDGFLGLKAGSVGGAGVCSINGTGTVTAGIDLEGNRLQIGGVGYISSDDAGGAFIARQLFREVYTTLYRCGEDTELVQPVLEMLGIQDKAYYIQTITKLYATKFSHTPYIQLVFDYAVKGDTVALKIIDHVACELAKATAGCIKNLNYSEEDVVEVILAGSVWVKPTTNILIDHYKSHVGRLTQQQCAYQVLQVPPAIGAILWALEIIHDHPVDMTLRERIVEEMEKLFK